MSILICSLIRVSDRKRKKLWISEQEMRQIVWFITYVLINFLQQITLSQCQFGIMWEDVRKTLSASSNDIRQESSRICIITGVIIEAFTPDYLVSNDALNSRVRSREALAIKWKQPLFRAPRRSFIYPTQTVL